MSAELEMLSTSYRLSRTAVVDFHSTQSRMERMDSKAVSASGVYVAHSIVCLDFFDQILHSIRLSHDSICTESNANRLVIHLISLLASITNQLITFDLYFECSAIQCRLETESLSSCEVTSM